MCPAHGKLSINANNNYHSCYSKKKKKPSQERRGQVKSSQIMVHDKKLSHYKEVSQKRKRMTFLYHESREQAGRSRPRRKSEHKQVWGTETASRRDSPDKNIVNKFKPGPLNTNIHTKPRNCTVKSMLTGPHKSKTDLWFLV